MIKPDGNRRAATGTSRFLVVYLLPILVVASCLIGVVQLMRQSNVADIVSYANKGEINITRGPSDPLRWEISDQPNEGEDEVSFIMRKIRRLNDCTVSAECRNSYGYDQFPQPLLNWAVYVGQGIGRLIEHSTAHCLNAASVGRGCLVDQTSRHLSSGEGGENRDSWYTFRSFVQVWVDVDLDYLAYQYRRNYTFQPHILTRETVEEARQAHALLPQKEWGHWTENEITKDIGFDHVLPLGDENVTQNLVETIRNNPDKLVLSPNWGTSWFTRIEFPVASLLPKSSNVTYKDIQKKLGTYMQNYMFRPTTLLYGLHKEYNKLVLGDGQEEVESYGAIHLRFFFLGVPSEKEDPEGSAQALRAWGVNLHKCIRYWNHIDPSVQKWWLITDNLEMGRNLTLNVREEISRMEVGNDNPQVAIFMEDGWPAGREPINQAQIVLHRVLRRRHDTGLGHSAGPTATGPMGHDDMADSLLDWMVLHEAKIAMLTAGSFGASGARGNGKFEGGSPLSTAITAQLEEEMKSCDLSTFRA
jgi:hypothetical protein